MVLVKRTLKLAAVGVHPDGTATPLPHIPVDVMFLARDNGDVSALLPLALWHHLYRRNPEDI